MLRRLALLVVFLGMIWALAGCASWHGWPRWPHKKKQPPRAVAPQAQFVGTITMVNEAARFVLIDNGMAPAPPSGVVLKSYGNGAATGELETSDVKRHPFVIADIRNGAPQKGDRVFLEPLHRGPSSTPAPVPAPPPIVPEPAQTHGNPLGLPPDASGS